MDNEETLHQTVGGTISGLVTHSVVPELDAYRFAKYASAERTGTKAGTLTEETLQKELDEAICALDNEDVKQDGRILYVSSNIKPLFNVAFGRQWASGDSISTYNDISIVWVPQKRFYTEIELETDSVGWSYKKAKQGKNINFMLIQPESVEQVVKFSSMKVFTPDEDQTTNALEMVYSHCHDAFVLKGKAAGIYTHTQ